MILVTGCAGFIGFHTALKFLSLGKTVIGIDNLNRYYDRKLKLERLKQLKKKGFKFKKISDAIHELKDLYNKQKLLDKPNFHSIKWLKFKLDQKKSI